MGSPLDRLTYWEYYDKYELLCNHRGWDGDSETDEREARFLGRSLSTDGDV
jgi:hypothetical protein